MIIILEYAKGYSERLSNRFRKIRTKAKVYASVPLSSQNVSLCSQAAAVQSCTFQHWNEPPREYIILDPSELSYHPLL